MVEERGYPFLRPLPPSVARTPTYPEILKHPEAFGLPEALVITEYAVRHDTSISTTLSGEAYTLRNNVARMVAYYNRLKKCDICTGEKKFLHFVVYRTVTRSTWSK